MTNTTKSRTELLDETAELDGQGYRLVEIHAVWPGNGRNEPEKVRIEVRWDTYARQSFAAVSVLTPDMKWTHLASLPTAEWHAGAESIYAVPKPDPARELGWVALNLLERATKILF